MDIDFCIRWAESWAASSMEFHHMDKQIILARLAVILMILFFLQEEHHKIEQKEIWIKKKWFLANRDLGEIWSRLGTFGSLLYFLKELCMDLIRITIGT